MACIFSDQFSNLKHINWHWLFSAQYPKGRDTRCHKVAAKNCLVWHVEITVAATEFCRCNLSHKFKLVWICATYRSDKLSASDLSQQQCRWGDLLPRRVATICRIVCLGLKSYCKNSRCRPFEIEHPKRYQTSYTTLCMRWLPKCILFTPCIYYLTIAYLCSCNDWNNPDCT